jgi:VanZ family protein
MRALSFRNWLPAVAWAAVILSLSGEGGSSSTTESLIQRIFGGLSPEALFYINYSLRKGAHVAGYGILGLLNFRASGYRRALMAVLLTLPVAIIDELHQGTTALRTASPADIGFDLCGAALFVMTGRLFHRRGGEDAEKDKD